MNVNTLSETPVRSFLSDIASEVPAPGAGSGAAVALAIGLACARKAIVFTLKHHPDEPDLIALGTHLAGLTDQAMAGGEADMQCFTAYIDALQRPKDDPGRAQAQQDALADLIAVGDNLVAIGDEARAKLLEVKADIYQTMMNDIGAALALIAAARSIHTACIAESKRALV